MSVERIFGWNVKVKASEFKAYDGDTLSEDQAGLVGATISFKNAHVNNHSGMTAPEITQYSPVANEVIVDASATSTDKVLLDAAATKGMGIWSTSFFDAPAEQLFQHLLILPMFHKMRQLNWQFQVQLKNQKISVMSQH